MPVCHTCMRTSATGEMRRTTKGHVCKDKVQCKRNLTRTRGAVVPDLVIADNVAAAARTFDAAADKDDPLTALRALSDLAEAGSRAAFEIVAKAARETRLTQKQLAEALGVPPSALRGLRG